MKETSSSFQEAFRLHKEREQHKKINTLRDIILGGQDGLVNVLGIVLGVSAVTSDVHILIATVLAAGFAESISMGAVAYTSACSQRDYYESEKRIEIKEIEEEPEMEREEIRQIYAQKGFKGAALEHIVSTITSNKEIWLELMMSEELHLQPIETKDILRSSLTVGIATVTGSLIPLLPFFFFPHVTGLILSIVMSTVALFAVGAYQAISLVGDWRKNGIQMVIIGLGAAFIGFLIAKLFHASAG